MNMQIITNQNAMQNNSNILSMSPFPQNFVASSTRVSQTMPRPSSAIPRKGVLGWAVLVQKRWTLLDGVISVGRTVGIMTARYRPRFLALVTQVAGDMGYTTQENQQLPQPSGIPSTMAPPPPRNKRVAYQARCIERDRCEHAQMKKPYGAAGQMWTACLLCGRRWRAVPSPQSPGGQRWAIDDPDDPDRTPASQGSQASSSRSAPSSTARSSKAPPTKARPSCASRAAAAMATADGWEFTGTAPSDDSEC